MLDSSIKTRTRGAFLETADLLRKEGVNVPLIIGGGAIDGAFASQGENVRYAKDLGRWWGCWMRLSGIEGNEPRTSWARHQRTDLRRLKERLSFDIQIDLTRMFLIRHG
jgi:hypothetical protein